VREHEPDRRAQLHQEHLAPVRRMIVIETDRALNNTIDTQSDIECASRRRSMFVRS